VRNHANDEIGAPAPESLATTSNRLPTTPGSEAPASPTTPGSEAPAMPTTAQVDGAVAAFALLADPTRVRLLWLLHNAEHDVGTLARLAGTTVQATSQHLAKLRLAGLVGMRREGRNHIYAARDTHVRHLVTEALHHADHQLSGYADHD